MRLNSGQYFGPDASVEATIPLADNLGLIAELGYFDEPATDGSGAWFVSRGAVLRWRPVVETELTALYSRYDYGDEEMGPTIYIAGAFLPKRIERRVFFGQDWGQWKGHSVNHGTLAKLERGPWLFEAFPAQPCDQYRRRGGEPSTTSLADGPLLTSDLAFPGITFATTLIDNIQMPSASRPPHFRSQMGS